MKPGRMVTVSVLVTALAALGGCGSSKSSTTATTVATPPTTAAAPTLAVSANTKLGQILVDSTGKTVYLFVPDGSSTTSTVTAAVKPNWPAVTVTGAPVAGSGLVQSKLTADPQPDGTKQVAYGGHLLYTFIRDAAPGDTNGQALGGKWYAVSPAGNQVG